MKSTQRSLTKKEYINAHRPQKGLWEAVFFDGGIPPCATDTHLLSFPHPTSIKKGEGRVTFTKMDEQQQILREFLTWLMFKGIVKEGYDLNRLARDYYEQHILKI